ncbi:MAG: hypothetical protein JNL66_25835 [Alphaproteobacteria bacterium]|nr:hypothetical protein [Alphaproteobacteria bacterium]
MLPLLIIAAFLVGAAPAAAQAPRPQAPAPRTAPQAPATLQVSADTCRRLVQHAPAPDVNYRPGVDAYGRPVAPADLAPAPILGPPSQMTLSIGADLRRYGVPATSPLFQPNVGVGEISFDLNGRVMFNGQPLGGPEQSALADQCRQRMQGR